MPILNMLLWRIVLAMSAAAVAILVYNATRPPGGTADEREKARRRDED